ncbi:MAG: hypothetical protein H6733_09805 [Alphaproteobacteria bacterium]|nr:hypothetical protein [Alphaproteobacteria bacterium]
MAGGRWDVGTPELFDGPRRVDDRRYLLGATSTAALLAVVVLANDALRELFLREMVGEAMSWASSNLTLLVLALVPMIAFGRRWKPESRWAPVVVGVMWCFVVAALEVLVQLLLFGRTVDHVVELFDPANVLTGNFYVGVLIVVAGAPVVLARRS